MSKTPSSTGSPAPVPLEWVRPTLQARSQQTVERILNAAEELLVESGSSGLTVAAVVKRAGSSVGAFYARFADKDALLSTLHARSCQQAVATAAAALDLTRWEGLPLDLCLQHMLTFIFTITEQRRGLWHSFIEASAHDPTFARRRGETWDAIAEHLRSFLVEHAHSFAHPDPALASTVIVRLLLATAEMETLQDSEHRLVNSGKEAVAKELTRVVLSYLASPLASPLVAPLAPSQSTADCEPL